MKKVLLLCVSYNSYKVLYEYIKSIDIAAKKALNIAEVVVAIADNTNENFQKISPEVQHIEIKVFPYHKNLGYIGGAEAVLKDLGREYVSQFDFVIVSNVDLILSNCFFEKLCIKEFSEDIGWIAPSIYRQDGSNANPFQLKRITRLKIYLLILMYSFPKLYGWYQQYRKSKQLKVYRKNEEKERLIFAGMGSLFIFTKKMIEKEYPMTFPGFMYGEEIYYGELVHKNEMKTLFVPSIEISTVGGVSTGHLAIKRICEMNKDSLKKINKIFHG